MTSDTYQDYVTRNWERVTSTAFRSALDVFCSNDKALSEPCQDSKIMYVAAARSSRRIQSWSAQARR
eukprot:scaffold2903_cov336-Prasinococcus_capsulatus_cf.AAC.5